MKIHKFPDGLTVRELKEILNEWPDLDDGGDPTEVWVETKEGLSNQVKEVWPLNKRGQTADIILI